MSKKSIVHPTIDKIAKAMAAHRRLLIAEPLAQIYPQLVMAALLELVDELNDPGDLPFLIEQAQDYEIKQLASTLDD